MRKTMRGKRANLDRSGRRSRDEGHRRKVKGSTRKGPESVREHKHPSTGKTNDSHLAQRQSYVEVEQMRDQ
jgi:hypothetical protein